VSIGAPPFGYEAGGSWLHRLSAVPKVAWLIACLGFCVVTLHPIPLLVLLVAALGLAVDVGVGGAEWRALRVLGPLAGSIIVLQVAAPSTCHGGCTVLASVGPVTVTGEALARGIGFVLRLLAMASVAVLLLATTRPADLFGALRRLHVPHTAAFVLAMTMDLVPLLALELGVVLDARRARGLRATGVGAIAPAVVPVFVAAFERMGRLAISMESRGYGAGVARTSYRTVPFGSRDRALAMAGAVAGVAGVAAGVVWWGPASVQAATMPGWAALAIVGASAAAFLAVVAGALYGLVRP
jgi:energy-coupling factor transport system permease protein